jgi:hypothetical protein
METLKAILAWLSGKKTIISGAIMTTSAYLAAIGVIDGGLAAYINAMTLLIFGAAAVATGPIVYNK